MQLFFADDSKQTRPKRQGMGPLVSVPDEMVRGLEQEINTVCTKYGFPNGVEFKWSPARNHWMYKNLRGEKRTQFFIEVLTLIADNGVKAIVVIEDEQRLPATNTQKAFDDVTTMFLERVNHELSRMETYGIVIIDQPGGGQAAETEYIDGCAKTLLNGTKYVTFNRIALNILCTPSHFSRLLQVADLVTSCTASAVAGFDTYTLPVFPFIKKILCNYRGKIRGHGLKIYPDQEYSYIYDDLLKDSQYASYYPSSFSYGILT